jgi:hypothetical protein
MVAADLDAAEQRIAEELGVELCFRDPGVAEFGLCNALFPIGDQFLEVVSPTEPETTAGRQLERRGGDSGYMVIVEVDDLAPVRQRLEALDTRVVFEAAVPGIVGLHLHPADVGGAILSIDETETWGEWPWAGPNWRDHVDKDRVHEVLAVTVEARDPSAMAQRWAEVLDCSVHNDVVVLPEGGELRFVSAGDRGEGVAGFTLFANSPADRRSLDICNCRFDIV